MNKNGLLQVVRRVASVITLVVFAGVAFGQNVENKDSTSSIRAEVFSVIKTACMTCHSNEGRDKPKAKVNFSVWDQYTPMEKMMISSSIMEEVKKGSMPPKRFLETHPEAVLTEAQISQISQWVESFKVKP
jgi:cytochrome c553